MKMFSKTKLKVAELKMWCSLTFPIGAPWCHTSGVALMRSHGPAM
jgi:hypothetical protein